MFGALAWAALASTACQVTVPEPKGGRTPRDRHPDAPPFNAAQSPAVLEIGLLPVVRADEMKARYAPLAAHLARGLSTRAEIQVSKSYDELITMLEDGRVDLVQLAPLAYVRARTRIPDLQLLATNIAEGGSSYSSYLITRRDQPFSSIAELKNKRFGFVDRTSTSGFLYATSFLARNGFALGEDWASAEFLGRHDVVLEKLITGEIDVGASYAGALAEARQRGLDVDQLRIAAKTGRIPNDAWCATVRLAPAVRAKIRSILLSASTRTPEGRSVLEAMSSVHGFTPAVDSDYDGVRHVLEHLDNTTGL